MSSLLVNVHRAVTVPLELRPSTMPGAPPISGQVTQVARCAYGHPSRLSRYSRPVWCRAAQPTQIEKSGRSGTSSSLGDVTQITTGNVIWRSQWHVPGEIRGDRSVRRFSCVSEITLAIVFAARIVTRRVNLLEELRKLLRRK